MTETTARTTSNKQVRLDERRRRYSGGTITTVIVVSILVLSTITLFTASTPQGVGLSAVVLMLVLIFLRVPVALAMAAPSSIGLMLLYGTAAFADVFRTVPFHTTASWSLGVIPMFVFMGLLLWRSGVTEFLYDAARVWLGWLPAGLAVGTNVAGAGLSSISGSTAGITYALARIGIPEMLKAGYDKRIAVGAIIVAGLPGQLIPPSIMLVLYAGIASVPVGPQLLAGIAPGILILVLCSATLILIGVFRPRVAGGAEQKVQVPLADKVRTLLPIWPIPILIVVVLGGMFSGVFTATEAGAAGALGALAIAFLLKRRNGQAKDTIVSSAVGTVSAVGSIFFLLMGAAFMTRLMSVTGLSQDFTGWVVESGLGRVEFLVLMVVVYLVLGTFLEPLAMMLLTVPVLLPTLAALDISVLWFGIFAVFLGELAVVHPPVGILAFIIYGITRDPEVNQGQTITLGNIFMSFLYFLPACLVMIAIMIAAPDFVTYLPNLL